ncbi:MAG: hypothetical protein ACE5EE_09145 [Fidelibacterota bacterium]
MSASIINNGNGYPSAFIGVVRDVTERDKHLRELEKWHRVTVDREMKMVEMKKQIQELEQNM